MNPLWRIAALLALSGCAPAPPPSAFPDNFIAQGIGPVPDALKATVLKYNSFRSASFAAWNPASHEMLILTRFGEAPQLHRVAAPGGDPSPLTSYPAGASGASFPPRDRGFFLLSRDETAAEKYQTWRYDLATGATTLLTDGKSRNSLGPWSKDGRFMAYTSGRRTGKDMDLWVMDPADPASDRLLAPLEGDGWIPLDWSPDGRAVLVLEYSQAEGWVLHAFDAASGERRRLTPKHPDRVAYRRASYAPDGKSLYVTTDLDSEFLRLARLDLATGRHEFLAPDIPWDVETLALSPDGSLLAFVTNEDGRGVLRLLDTATGKEKPVPPLPGWVLGGHLGLVPPAYASGIHWHPDGSLLSLQVCSALRPSDVYALAPGSGKLARWTSSETGGVDFSGLTEPEAIRWPSADGREIPGFLYRPPRTFTGPRPVLVLVHGGPAQQFRPDFLGRMGYYLLELGMAVVAPNVRGSSGYGKTFRALDNGLKREGAYEDLDALLAWIGTRPDLDSGRILVYGGSYGGHMALVASYRSPDRIRAAVSVVGVSSLVPSPDMQQTHRRPDQLEEYGDERDPEVLAFLERASPLAQADRIAKPLLVVHGARDRRVPVSQSDRIVAALQGRKVPVGYLLAKDEGHGFRKRANQDVLAAVMAMFVQEHVLKP